MAAARQRAHSQPPTQCTTVVPGIRHHGAESNNVTVSCMNVQSVGNKSATLSCMVVDNQLDIFVVTETWHEDLDLTLLK